MIPNTTPSVRAQFTHRRTYLRPLDEDGTRFETVNQAADRVLGHQVWLWEKQLGRPLRGKEWDELTELAALMEEKKVSMSGRVKWMGGTDLVKERAAGAFNCLGVETRFITDQGVKSFADFKDGDTVRVWTHRGRWQDAVVRSYGQQQLNTLTLRRSARKTVTVRSTADHRWLLTDGSETRQLRVGQRLLAPTSHFYGWIFDEAPLDEKLWWAYGYVYGDGTVTKDGSRNINGSMVRLCGRDKDQFLHRFTELGFSHSFPPSCNDDPIVYTGHYLKTLPEDGADPRMVAAFIRGYLDADGAKVRSSFERRERGTRRDDFHRILATKPEAQAFIERWFPVVGLYITAVADAVSETNYGARSHQAKWYSFFGDAGGSSHGSTYLVTGIEQSEIEEVWCLEVEEDHSFTLADGVVTGNCSFSVAYTPADLVDIFWLLLNGCGVGFKPMPGLLSGFPASIKTVEIVPSERTERGGAEASEEIIDVENGVWTIKFGDSAKGWAKAIGMLFGEKPRVHTLRLDFSELRPGGKRLRGYGWISSGWRPLADAMKKIAVILQQAANRPLTLGEIIDVVNLLGTVLSSRRSAQLCLIETDATTLDELFNELHWYIEFKTNRWEKGQGQREQSNNSIGFRQKPSRAVIVELLRRILPTGEPGFVNVEQARKRAPEMEGLNPCLTGDTLVPIHGQGLRRIAELAGGSYPVRDANGDIVDAVFEKTGEQQALLSVELSDGSVYRVTPTHEFVQLDGSKIQAQYLTPGSGLKTANIVEGFFGNEHRPVDAYLDAWLIADGTWHNDQSGSKLQLYTPKFHHQAELEAAGCRFTAGNDDRIVGFLSGRPAVDKTRVPAYVLAGGRETVAAFLRGYTQSDGHVGHTEKGWLVQWTSIHRGFLQEMQALLRMLGVRSKLSLGRAAGPKALPGGIYECKDCWRLTVSNPAKFFETYDPSLNKRGAYETKEEISVSSVTKIEEREDVFCAGVPTTASFDLPTVHSGNCAEILLPNKGFCNLVQVVWHRFNGDMPGLMRAQELAARANYRQTCVSMRDGVLQLQWNDMQKLLRLCGVSPTGCVAWEGIKDPKALQAARDAAIAGADSMADEFGTPRARRVTQVQPAGTSSKALGLEGDEVHEGAHLALSRWIFNWINFPANDPMLEAFATAGYDMKPNPNDPTGTLVCWPVEYPASPMFTPVRGALREGVEREWDIEFQQHVYAKDGQLVQEADAYEHLEVNQESAVSQLERYRILMDNYVQHNCSITVSFDDSEIDDVADWFMQYWDSYVGVSFLKRNNPLATAEELGFKYLPQECVSREKYEAYSKRLLPIDISQDKSAEMLDQGECATGGCPVR